MPTPEIPKYVICINNTAYPASLELRKLYSVTPDAFAASHRLLRVIDESGEDYLYSMDYFVPVELSEAAEKVVATIA